MFYGYPMQNSMSGYVIVLYYMCLSCKDMVNTYFIFVWKIVHFIYLHLHIIVI